MEAKIDVPLQECRPLAEAVSDWPRAAGGRRIGISSLYLYAKKGLHGVKLRTVRVPGVGRVTHPKWITEFIAKLNATEGIAS